MEDRPDKSARSDDPKRPQPHKLYVPGFVRDEEIGLGDLISRATSAVGVRPCGGCRRRAAALYRWLVFAGQRRK